MGDGLEARRDRQTHHHAISAETVTSASPSSASGTDRTVSASKLLAAVRLLTRTAPPRTRDPDYHLSCVSTLYTFTSHRNSERLFNRPRTVLMEIVPGESAGGASRPWVQGPGPERLALPPGWFESSNGFRGFPRRDILNNDTTRTFHDALAPDKYRDSVTSGLWSVGPGRRHHRYRLVRRQPLRHGKHVPRAGFPPSPPYYHGHYSNGPIWLEYLAGQLGVSAPTPSLAGGTDNAWGGAQTGDGYSFLGTPNIGSQISTYLATNTLAAPSSSPSGAGRTTF